jgi:hypothetical protein
MEHAADARSQHETTMAETRERRPRVAPSANLDRKRRLSPLAPFMPVGLGGETAVTQALRRSPCLHLVRGDVSAVRGRARD